MNPYFRLFVDLILLILIFIVPWWVVIFLGSLAAFFIPSFYEIMLIGIVVDSFYNVATPTFHGIEFVVTFLTIFIYILIALLKRRLRFYAG